MRRIQWVLTLSLLLAGSASYAGISGKIMGRVIDSQTQGPLIGVNIIIEGTTLGAASDAQGNFVIINIPPGTFSVKASMIGYKPVIIQNIRLKVDLTTRLRFEMIPTVLDLGESVIVTAERNMIQMDVTSSQAIIGSDEIEEMPVEEFEEIIKLQAGVIEGSGGEMHIRGGRSSEISYLIDGISVTDPFSNAMGVEIENNAIQELQVISGTFNAEYGQAMSAIINIVTKEGKFDKYSGNLSLYLGDYYTRDTDIYYLGDDFQVNGITDLKASFSGPVPIFKDKASFFLSGRYNKEQGYYWGKRRFNPDTWVLDSTHTQWDEDTTNLGDGKDVAMNPSRQLSLQGKIAVRLFPNLKLIVSGQGSDTWYQTYSHRYIYNPDGRLHYFGKNFNGIITLNHTLSSRTFYSLKYSYTQNENKHYWHENPEDSTKYNTDPLVFNEFTGYNFYAGGMSMSHYYRTSIFRTLKYDFNSQINMAHLIRWGFEYKTTSVNRLDFAVQVNKNTDWLPKIPIYDPEEPSTEIYKSSINYDKSYHNPYDWSVYFQDKMEFSDMIVNIGLRYEYFNSNGKFLSDPRDPNPYSPIHPNNRFWDYGTDGVGQNDPGYTGPDSDGTEGNGSQDPGEIDKTDEERLEYWFEDSEPKTQLSPRFGIAYPITDQGVIHFSYGHFLQMPPLTYMYDNPDFEVSAGFSSTLGNANLEPQRTVQYEIGLQQQITDDIAFDVTGFYKDVRNLTSTEVIETYIGGTFYAKYINYDFGNTKGITFALNKRRSGLISASVDYTYSIAEGNASDPNANFWDVASGAEPQKQLIYLNWDQRHTLNASVSFANPRSWGISFLGYLGSGLPYTPSNVSGDPETFKNSARKPVQYNVDVKLFKKISLGQYRISLLCNVYNLFDRRNSRYVFARTGRADYNLRDGVPTEYGYDIRPDYYTAPRLIKFGAEIEFK